MDSDDEQSGGTLIWEPTDMAFFENNALHEHPYYLPSILRDNEEQFKPKKSEELMQSIESDFGHLEEVMKRLDGPLDFPPFYSDLKREALPCHCDVDTFSDVHNLDWVMSDDEDGDNQGHAMGELQYQGLEDPFRQTWKPEPCNCHTVGGLAFAEEPKPYVSPCASASVNQTVNGALFCAQSTAVSSRCLLLLSNNFWVQC